MAEKDINSTSYRQVSVAPYASKPARSRGRLYGEAESATRSPFQRDRDRIIHSGAFRRLKHKTQVFVYHEGDYYRTRLTHSLEVAQIARSISRHLGLDEDLAEAVALAHDLGHPPFGHAGEGVLQDCMMNFDGFDHNAHSLRIVTELEQHYPEFDGLNLTWETLEGLVKHNGPVIASDGTVIPIAITRYCERHDLELNTFASVEAQIAALSDDIAYNNHDIDDGLRAELFTIDDLRKVSLAGEVIGAVESDYPDLERPRLIHEVVRRLIGLMVNDALSETTRRLEAAGVKNVEDVRGLDHAVGSLSETMQRQDRELKSFLWDNMYHHAKVSGTRAKAKAVVKDLFDLFIADPSQLPPDWGAQCNGPGASITARVVCDYIAGMTDRFALQEHAKLIPGHKIEI